MLPKYTEEEDSDPELLNKKSSSLKGRKNKN